MLNAIGYVISQADGRYKGTLDTVSIKTEIGILLNILKTDDSQPDFRTVIEGEILVQAGSARRGLQQGICQPIYRRP
jgi:uncharacterized protein (DUF736 family)